MLLWTTAAVQSVPALTFSLLLPRDRTAGCHCPTAGAPLTEHSVWTYCKAELWQSAKALP